MVFLILLSYIKLSLSQDKDFKHLDLNKTDKYKLVLSNVNNFEFGTAFALEDSMLFTDNTHFLNTEADDIDRIGSKKGLKFTHLNVNRLYIWENRQYWNIAR